MFGKKHREGWTYVHEESDPLFTGKKAGDVVRIPKRSGPWLVVDHGLSRIIVARWPGRLWRVTILDEISEAEERKARSERTPEGRTWYTRAAAIRLEEDAPAHILFGVHGERIAAIVDRAHRLDKQEAMLLADARSDRATDVRAAAWAAWPGDNPRAEMHVVDSHGNYLGASGASPRSPVGAALSLIEGEVSRRAQAVDGDEALVTDPDDPEGAWLADPWATASAALGDAAMAAGAVDLMTEDGRNLLLGPWRKVFGAEPG
jgi:hypothetical protein